MKRRSLSLLVFTLLLFLSVIFTVNADSLQEFGTGWTVQYWNNTNLSGSPVLSQVLTDGINFNFGTSSPAPGVVNDDNFAVRYSSVQLFNAGLYEFVASSDDGVRVFVDGVLILDRFIGRQLTTDRFQVTLTSGTHSLVVEYFEGIDQSAIQFQWFQITSGTGSVSGRVTDTSGTPLEDVLLTSDSGNVFACTNATGDYTAAISLNIPIKLFATSGQDSCDPLSNANYVREWWQEKALYADATLITLTTLNANISNVNFTLEVGATVKIALLLQDRSSKPHPSWMTTAHVLLTPDTATLPTWDEFVTTDDNGKFQLTGVATGTYTLWVKGDTMLASARTVTLTAGENNISMGPMREGDADGNGLVNILDFSILATAFGKASGQVGYNANVNFNKDLIINIADFALLATSFGQSDDSP